MDPITHAVVGLSIAVLAGEPLAATNPAIIGCMAGAVIPDGDIIMQLKGDYVYLKNHRGMSHSIPMMFVYSAAITGLLWLLFGNIAFSKVLLFFSDRLFFTYCIGYYKFIRGTGIMAFL